MVPRLDSLLLKPTNGFCCGFIYEEFEFIAPKVNGVESFLALNGGGAVFDFVLKREEGGVGVSFIAPNENIEALGLLFWTPKEKEEGGGVEIDELFLSPKENIGEMDVSFFVLRIVEFSLTPKVNGLVEVVCAGGISFVFAKEKIESPAEAGVLFFVPGTLILDPIESEEGFGIAEVPGS